MSLERLLADETLPADVLKDTCIYIQDKTGSVGGFIAIGSINYFDTVSGSLRYKRKGSDEGSISMPDLINIEKETGIYLKDNIYIYRSYFDWYVGLDEPIISDKRINNLIWMAIRTAYPVYNLLLKNTKKSEDRDILTGLLTRRRFFKDLKANIKTSLSTGVSLWIFYIDFNNFKLINDKLGHDMGDRVLMSISSDMRDIFLGYGKLYRIGGDEFCGLTLALSDKDINTVIGMLESVSEQAPCGLFVNLSVGADKLDKHIDISDFKNKEEDIIKEVILRAEAGMYSKKKNKRQDVKIACEYCPKNFS